MFYTSKTLVSTTIFVVLTAQPPQKIQNNRSMFVMDKHIFLEFGAFNAKMFHSGVE